MNENAKSQINSLSEVISQNATQRVLLVDDDNINRWLAAYLLKQKSYDVTTVTNGEEAVTAVKKEQFDLVLMDVHMPVMDGLTATHIIRQHEQQTGTHIPIIAFTSEISAANVQQFWEAGMDSYMEKTIHPDEFFSTIEAVLTLDAKPSQDAPLPLTFDLVEALQRVNHDAALLRQTAEQFLNHTPHLISTIDRAIAIEDSRELHIAAHWLGNIASNLSAYGLVEIAKRLELIGSVRKLTQAKTSLTALEQELAQFNQVFAEAMQKLSSGSQ